VICVLGDAHLDVVVCAREPLARETDTRARTSVGAGGQAANVAAWVVALGGRPGWWRRARPTRRARSWLPNSPAVGLTLWDR